MHRRTEARSFPATAVALLLLTAVAQSQHSAVPQIGSRSPAVHEAHPPAVWLPAEQPLLSFSVPDDTIQALAVDGDRLYIGGRFGWVGRYTGASARMDINTGAPASNWPRIAGQVKAVVIDPSGGWIVGGTLESVNGESRQGIIRIAPDGSLDAWDPKVPNGVRALARRGSTLYIGGDFPEVIGGVPAALAAIDLNTGDVLPWRPSGLSGWTSTVIVNALAASPAAVYVGGFFATTMGGSFRRNFAALDPVSAVALAPNPAPEGTVEALLDAGSEVLVGGSFGFIGGRPIAYLATMNPANGAIDTWNPQLDGSVRALARSANTVYVGGSFHTSGSQPRNCAAAFSLPSHSLLAWNPNVSDPAGYPNVQSLAVASNGVYVGGEFRGVGGAALRSLARVDPTSGLATAWTGDVAGEVHSLAPTSTGVVVGGRFELVGGEARAGLAAISLTSGDLLPWAPGVHNNLTPEIIGSVTDIVPAGGKVYVAGGFRYVNGEVREQLALIDGQTSALDLSFDAQLAHGFVIRELVHMGSVLYAAGSMMIPGAGQRTLAAFNSTTGAWIPSWDAQTNSTVYSIELSKASQQLLITGPFVEVGSPPQPRAGVAAVDVLTGQVTPWDPHPNGPVTDVALFGENTWISGDFDVLGGTHPREVLAQVDATTGIPSRFEFDPHPGNPDVISLARHGVVLYVGGRFEVGPLPYTVNLLALDTRTGQPFGWSPQPNREVGLMLASQSHLLVSGDFTSIGGVGVARLAVFPLEQVE